MLFDGNTKCWLHHSVSKSCFYCLSCRSLQQPLASGMAVCLQPPASYTLSDSNSSTMISTALATLVGLGLINIDTDELFIHCLPSVLLEDMGYDQKFWEHLYCSIHIMGSFIKTHTHKSQRGHTYFTHVTMILPHV